MRIFKAAVLVLLIGGCHRASSVDVPAADRIECAIGGADLANDCAIQRNTNVGEFAIHHLDGGFRRFAVEKNGTISAADGADTVSSKPIGDGRVELKIAGDRYILGSASIAPAKTQ
ncbi:hypothetical protein [Sphingomonas paeninsulae]|uniref:hypothetical protein n=1 Tax=Sphingomonas paeninsulae TaxID=2319844 RepID=UPI0013CF1099|nr:hypothetical protein [Sphingomonas paeninsulae]